MASAKSFDQTGNLPVTRVHSPVPVHRIVDDRVSEDASIGPRLSSDQIQVLEDHFAENPYPVTKAKKQLAGQLGLSLQRVNNWYQNRRAKARHAGIQKNEPGPGTSDIFASHSDEEVILRGFPNIKDQRLVTDLHVCCLCIFDMFRQSPAALSSSFKDSDRNIVDEQMGRLFLWGQGFNPEELEDALDQSKELREIVLESLCEIGKLIIHNISPQTEEILASREYPEDDPARRFQELNTLISRAESSLCKNSLAHELGSDNEGEDALDDISSEDDAEVSEIGVNLEFHVQCLMDLIPSLQQNIAHAEKHQPKISNPEAIATTTF